MGISSYDSISKTGSTPRVFTIAPGQPFLRQLVASLHDPQARAALFGPCELADITILVPTRRAARLLSDYFLSIVSDVSELPTKSSHASSHASSDASSDASENSTAIWLPQIRTIGDVEEDGPEGGHFFNQSVASLNVLPAIEEFERHYYLMHMVRKWWLERRQQNLSSPQSAALAADLIRFLDMGQNDEVDWQELSHLVPEELAQNWQDTIEFLSLITQSWPDYLDAAHRLDPVDRRNRLLANLSRYWAENPPKGPVIAAGSTGTLKATSSLLNVIARLPQGAIILPGLDMDSDDTLWEAMREDPSHPQTSMARLLYQMGVDRDAVQLWPGSADSSDRARLLHRAMVPANHTGGWALQAQDGRAAPSTQGIHLLEAPDLRSEAGTIALHMREVLETSNQTAALVTPDRNLARRVMAELRRWGIEVDDSAGKSLRITPAAIFFQLIIEAVLADFSPVALLAILRHPMSHLGQCRADHLRCVANLEAQFLRGPKTNDGLAGLLRRIDRAQDTSSLDTPELDNKLSKMRQLVDAVILSFEPLTALRYENHGVGTLLAAMQNVARNLARDHSLGSQMGDAQHASKNASQDKSDESLDQYIFAGPAGEALSAFFESLLVSAATAPDVSLHDWLDLLRQWMDGKVVRDVRLGSDRLHIWGLLESRLMHCDVMILGGLNEGIWPPLPDTGPWLSRPMRKQIGMASPERRIGLAAHDFVQAACADRVILTRSQKVDGSPTVASRWVRRLEILTGELEQASCQQRFAWWQALDRPDAINPAARPAPCPPVEQRPKQLSVTRIETLIRDPYAVYATHILGLRAWDEVETPFSAAHRGTLLHKIVELFLQQYPSELPENISQRLQEIARDVVVDTPGGEAAFASWSPRFKAISEWLSGFETGRRDQLDASYAEISGRLDLDIAGEPFRLTAKADRIDRLKDGQYAIIDYKTGQVPSSKHLREFWSVQMILEAAILSAGGFEGLAAGNVNELKYVRLSGGDPAGEITDMGVSPQMIDQAVAILNSLIAKFRDPQQPFISRMRPKLIGFKSDYDHLARVEEWSNLHEEAADQ